MCSQAIDVKNCIFESNGSLGDLEELPYVILLRFESKMRRWTDECVKGLEWKRLGREGRSSFRSPRARSIFSSPRSRRWQAANKVASSLMGIANVQIPWMSPLSYYSCVCHLPFTRYPGCFVHEFHKCSYTSCMS